MIFKNLVPPFSVSNILYEESSIAFPTLLFYFFYLIVALIGLAFIGSKNENEKMIDAIGVVNLWINLLLDSIISGATSGLETLCSNSILTKKYKLIGYYFHRARIVSYSIAIVLGIIYFCTIKQVLKMFKLDEETIEYGLQYAYIFIGEKIVLIPQNYCVFRILNIVEKNIVNLINTIISFCFLIFFDWLFIWKLDIKVYGFAIAQCISIFVQCLLGTLYLWFYHPYPVANFLINKQCFKWEGIIHYLSFTVGSGFLEIAELISSELITLLAVLINHKFLATKGDWFSTFLV